MLASTSIRPLSAAASTSFSSNTSEGSSTLGIWMERVKNYLYTEKNIPNAFNNMRTLLVSDNRQISKEDATKCYKFLIDLIPELELNQVNEILILGLSSSQPSLNLFKDLTKEQLDLALAAGNRIRELAISLSDLETSMHYFAKAIAISGAYHPENLDKIHHHASRVFVKFIELAAYQTQTWENRLGKAIDNRDLSKVENLLDQIEALKQFCIEEEDLKIIDGLFNHAQKAYTDAKYHANQKGSTSSSVDFFIDCERKIIEKLNFTKIPHKGKPYLATRTYYEALEEYRKGFKNAFESLSSNQSIRVFQEKAHQQFQRMIEEVFVKDLLMMIGEPLCDCHFLMMGSRARQESGPYSDIEWVLIIENQKTVNANHRTFFPFFERMINGFNLQLISLNETENPNIIFSSIEMRSGLHLDEGNERFAVIRTPEELANNFTSFSNSLIPNSLNNMIHKTLTLCCRDPQNKLLERFYEKKREHLNFLHDEQKIREKRAIELIKNRVGTFKNELALPPILSSIIDIKKAFMEPLFHLLGDFALYFGIEETNTFDILNALTELKMFTRKTSELIKRSIETIYTIRVRLHFAYGRQAEEAILTHGPLNPSYSNVKLLTPIETGLLLETYWLILYPLYDFLDKILEEPKIPNMSLDLIKMAFKKGLLNSDKKLSYAKKFAPIFFHVAKNTYSKERHFEQYIELSTYCFENDILRETYLKGVQKKEIYDCLSDIPDMSGLRRSYLNQQKLLYDTILLTSAPSANYMDDRGISVKVSILNHSFYLDPNLIKDIINNDGTLRKHYQKSAHNVCPIKVNNAPIPEIHLKEKPTHALVEYAIHSLASRITNDRLFIDKNTSNLAKVTKTLTTRKDLTPTVTLIRFDVDTGSNKIMYPVLVSETIQGSPVPDSLSWSNCDQAHWTRLFLSTILTRPGDGIPSNYIFKNGAIFSIDNDISFVEPLTKKILKTINFCSAPFAAFQAVELDKPALEAFCNLSSNDILTNWIDELIEKEKEWLELFSDTEIKDLLEKDSCKINLLFKEGTLALLDWQFVHLQAYLKSNLELGKSITSKDLLEQLLGLNMNSTSIIPVGEYIAHCYVKAERFYGTINRRLSWITSRKTTKSMNVMKSDLACLGKIPTFEEVKDRKKFSAEQAKHELMRASIDRRSDVVIYKELPLGGSIQINFLNLSGKFRQQYVIDQASVLIHEKRPSTLIISFCEELDAQKFKLILHEDLKILHIESCQKFDTLEISIIQDLCPNLEELHLKNCPDLKSIKSNTLITVEPLMMKKLLTLQILSCKSLTLVSISAPFLSNLTLFLNPLLKGVYLNTFTLKFEDPVQCPKLKEVKILFDDSKWLLPDDPIWDDNDLMHKAVQRNGIALRYASKRLKNDQKIVWDALLQNYDAFEYAGYYLKDDADTVTAAIKHNPWTLKYANARFKDYEKFVMIAVQQDIKAFQLASDRLKDDKSFVLSILNLDLGYHSTADILKYMNSRLKDDDDVIWTAVNISGFALKYASNRLKDDFEMVHRAVRVSGWALEYASKRLRNEDIIVLSAFINSGYLPLKYASRRLKKAYEYEDD